MAELVIREEQEQDWREVEAVTREAFWNLYTPGCDEHYLAHCMRRSPDFIPGLAFVAELKGKVIGSILFTKSYILNDDGARYDTITFGPISVLPKFQGQGVGSALIEYARQVAAFLEQ